ncbi:hypothetical protein Trydic_g16066 [Trypoxylus dichotomus]
MKVLLQRVRKQCYHTERWPDGLKVSMRDVRVGQLWLDQIALVLMKSKCKLLPHGWIKIDVSRGGMKIASRWVFHNLREMQQLIRHDAAQIHLEHYGREGDAFLCCSITLDKIWARSNETKLMQ